MKINKVILIVGLVTGLTTLALNVMVTFKNLNNPSDVIVEKNNEKLSDMILLQRYLSELKDGETGQRGYIITGDKVYLEPYNRSMTFIESPQAQTFLEKIEKESAYSNEVQQLKKLAQAKINELKQTLHIYDVSGFQGAKEAIQTNTGKNSMDAIRILVAKMVFNKQNDLLDYKNKNDSNFNLIVNYMNIISSLILIFCLSRLYKTPEDDN